MTCKDDIICPHCKVSQTEAYISFNVNDVYTCKNCNKKHSLHTKKVAYTVPTSTLIEIIKDKGFYYFQEENEVFMIAKDFSNLTARHIVEKYFLYYK